LTRFSQWFTTQIACIHAAFAGVYQNECALFGGAVYGDFTVEAVHGEDFFPKARRQSRLLMSALCPVRPSSFSRRHDQIDYRGRRINYLQRF